MGFFTVTGEGHEIHIKGDMNMRQGELDALHRLFDKAIAQAIEEAEEHTIATNCEHEWIDRENKAGQNVEVCINCFGVRSR